MGVISSYKGILIENEKKTTAEFTTTVSGFNDNVVVFSSNTCIYLYVKTTAMQ